jgi:mRNA interferase MazF
LVVSSDPFNRSRLRTVLAVILTANLRLVDAPGNVLVPARASGLPRDSVANVSQLVTLDKDFLTELAGRIRGATLSEIDSGLRLVLAL